MWKRAIWFWFPKEKSQNHFWFKRWSWANSTLFCSWIYSPFIRRHRKWYLYKMLWTQASDNTSKQTGISGITVWQAASWTGKWRWIIAGALYQILWRDYPVYYTLSELCPAWNPGRAGRQRYWSGSSLYQPSLQGKHYFK